MNTKLQQRINELMVRVKAGETDLVPSVIELYNTRQTERRGGFYTIKGWSVCE